jgi:small-conductance mechanosensitive channel
MTLNEIAGWIVSHGLLLVVGALILFAIYRFTEPLIHRVVTAVLHVQQAALEPGAAPTEELQKRAATLELVLRKLIRAAFVIAIILLVLGVFDLWELVAGLGLIAAALTLAGQSIVLDYLMGILILVEGPYFKGDWISVTAPGITVEGEVEEIGLRRTVLRDGLGAEHAVSNGLIRLSSNLTRVYSVATVDLQVVRPLDLDRAIAVAGRVGREIGDDPEWRDRLFEAPVATNVVALTLDGATIRVQRRVPPGLRSEATSELRRRLVEAMNAESIGTGRWDTPMPAAAPAAAAMEAAAEAEAPPGPVAADANDADGAP